MKYNMYAVFAVTFFVGFGLNGTDNNDQKPNAEENKRTWKEFVYQATNPSLKKEDMKYDGTSYVNRIVCGGVKKTEYKQGQAVSVDDKYYNLLQDLFVKNENIENQTQDNNQFTETRETKLAQGTTVYSRGGMNKERAVVAVAGLGLAIYYRNEIGNGISYAAKGTCNQVGRAAGWVASLFKSSPKQDAQSK